MSAVNHSDYKVTGKILKCLQSGPKTCGQVADATGLNLRSAREWLAEMQRDGTVVEVRHNCYAVPSGGYSPGGNAA